MGEYLSPILEGFSSPTMDNIFQNMLQSSTATTITDNVNFLKALLQQQKDLASSLITSSKTISPISQKIGQSDKAYSAAFETDITAPLPNITGTLQGFTLFFVTLSYFSLAIVSCVNVNELTGNTMVAVYTFIGFILMFFMLLSLISRLG